MLNDEYWELYHNNSEFHTYVDTYCRSRGKGLFEALDHITVTEVAKYYKDKFKAVIEPARQQASCDAR